MLIAISNYLKPLDEIDVHRPAHQEFLKKYFSEQKFIISGRRVPANLGGVIVAVINSKEEFEEILSKDPFVKNACALYQITEFNPTFCDAVLEDICQIKK